MSEITVDWADVVRFVRQLNHDVRNHLNAIELQAAFLNEIAPDGELKDEVKRLRETLATVATALQKLSLKLAEPKLNVIPYRAADFMEDLQKKLEREKKEQNARMRWEIAAPNETVDVDPQLLQEALFELIDNSFQFSPPEAKFDIRAEVRGRRLAITLREPKAADSALTTSPLWGREPLKKVRHGHYGLGLTRARAIIEAHGGELRADYDAKEHALVTTILLPVSVGGT
jgi:two-component system, OmpR family, sensor histidine kinase CiaH